MADAARLFAERPDFQAIFESLPGQYLVLLPDAPRFTIIGATDAYLQATMTVREEIIGRGLFEIFPDDPDDPAPTGVSNLAAFLQRVLASRHADTMAIQKYPVRRPTADGGSFEERYWSPINTPVFGRHSEIRYIVHRVQDVTEFVRQRETAAAREQTVEQLRGQTEDMAAEIYLRAHEIQEADRQLRAALDKAREALRVRDQVLSAVSHDLQTPLTAIKAQAQALERWAVRQEVPGRERLLEGLRQIDASATRMTTWIHDLLDVARLEVGQPLSLRLAPTDLVGLVAQAVDEHQQATSQHTIRLEANEQKLVGAWDAARLRRVLDNLLGNAIKYSPEGGPITVSVGRQQDPAGAWAVVCVRDQGVGIHEKDQPHIFDPFRRAANVAGRIAGSGIGLAGSCQIVQQHGGSIDLESREGQGSTFRVRLPLRPLPAPDTSPA
jgi:signal transduction histidine kinase